jgi:uncharacterized membrane protein
MSYNKVMHTFLFLYGFGLLAIVVADLLWVGVIGHGFYTKHIGYLLGEVRWVPAILFYLLFTLGFTYFVTYPLSAEPLHKAILAGAFFGLVAYATYDLTSNALIRDWPVVVTIVDMIWGTALGAWVAVAALGLHRVIG